MKSVVVVGARRTAQGRFMGSLAGMGAVDLAVAAGLGALGPVAPADVDEVIVGHVLGAGQGMNVARQVGMRLGLPVDRAACTVNMMCASGMQAVILAARSIRAGEARVVLCGGTESMSTAPYLLDRARAGYKLGDGVLIDSLLRDGLVDAFSREHMGLSAERLAERYQLSREMQDAFAADSHRKAGAAQAAGRFAAEIQPLDALAADEHPRPDTTAAVLGSLRPAFRPDGTVTAGNASGINDGAAMLVVCDGDEARRRGWKPLAVLTGWATVGCDPQWMGLGPVHATRKLCAQMDLSPDAFDAVELNEAFAAQALACIGELGLDPARVNPDGGAIALGHPIGASGARLVVHLAHAAASGRFRRTLATLCVGGGMGAAMAVEALPISGLEAAAEDRGKQY